MAITTRNDENKDQEKILSNYVSLSTRTVKITYRRQKDNSWQVIGISTPKSYVIE